MAKVTALEVVGSDPVEMLGGPIPATEGLLRTGLGLDEVDLFE